jgi:flagellin
VAVTIGNVGLNLKVQRHLNRSTDEQSTAFRRLSSGLRIDRAVDDAAGLQVSMALETGSTIERKGLQDVNDAISLLSVADSALGALSEIVARQGELAEQAASGALSSAQRVALNRESYSLTNEYNRLIQSTSFNGSAILDGSQDAIRFQHGIGLSNSTLVSLGEKLGTVAGSGEFGSTGTISASSVYGLKAAFDFDGDGHLDIVNSDGVLLGNGDGTFQTGATIALSGLGTAEIFSDFNDDGIVDYVLDGGGYYGTYLGNGDGTFRVASSIAVPASSSRGAGDFNNDGRVDIVLGFGVTDAVFLGNGNGTFAGPRTLQTSNSRFFQDLNGDGNLDIVSSDGRLQMGNGDGSFQAATTVANEFVLAVSDFNSDGNLDLYEGIGANGFVRLGNGNGTFGPQTTSGASGFSYPLLFSDLNGDNRTDIIALGSDDQFIATYLDRGNGTFSTGESYAQTAAVGAGLTGDFNGDGVQDLVWVDSGDGSGTYFNLGVVDPTGRRNNLIDPFDLSSITGARAALGDIATQTSRISAERGIVGAYQSRLGSVVNYIRVAVENYDAARGRIVDADVASEVARLIRSQVVQQAATAVLAQANISPNLALRLLDPSADS